MGNEQKNFFKTCVLRVFTDSRGLTVMRTCQHNLEYEQFKISYSVDKKCSDMILITSEKGLKFQI